MNARPTGVEVFEVDPVGKRDEWLALRQQDVTASVVGSLLGIHPYKSRYALWMEKAGRVQEQKAETSAMLRGRVLERPALDLLALDRPLWKIEQPNIYLRDPAARLGATPDAYAVNPEREGFGVVQVKSVEQSVFRRNWIDDDGEVEPPLWIAIQAILEAHLSGASWACVAALVVGFGIDLHVLEVPIHGGIVDRIRDEARDFWKSIAENNPPDPNFGQDAALIAGLYTRTNGEAIDLSADNMLPAILSERADLKKRISADTERVKEIDAEIVAKLGEYEEGFLPGWRIKRPVVERKEYVVKATKYRRLTIKEVAAS